MSRIRLLAGSLLGLLLLQLAAPALSATRTWTGAGGNNNWSTAANWGGTAPIAGDDLIFPNGAARLSNNNDFAAGTNFNSITIGALGVETNGYTLGGNAINLAAGLSAYSNGLNTINLSGITLTSNQSFYSAYDTFGGSKRLTINPPINLQGFTLSLNVPGTLDLMGAISGTGGVSTVTGNGVIFLNGTPNTYTGPTTINAGGVAVCGVALNPAGAVTVNGGTLQLCNSGSVGNITVNSGGVLSLQGGGGDQHGFATSLTMNSGATFYPAFYSLTNYGQLNVSGSVTLNSPTLLTGWAAYTSGAGNSFIIVVKNIPGPVIGSFITLPEGAAFTANTRRYLIYYTDGDGNDTSIVDSPLAPVSTAAIPTLDEGGLIALSLLLLAAFGWRQRSATRSRR